MGYCINSSTTSCRKSMRQPCLVLITWLPADFSTLKMFKLQHQFNNIVETTQLTNDQMLEFHCHCEYVTNLWYLAMPFSTLCLLNRNKNSTNRRCHKIFTVCWIRISKNPHSVTLVALSYKFFSRCKKQISIARSRHLCWLAGGSMFRTLTYSIRFMFFCAW